MNKIIGNFRSTGVRLIGLHDNEWRIELWDWNNADKPPFATKQVSTGDPKGEAVELLAVTFGEEARVIRRDLKWQSDR